MLRTFALTSALLLPVAALAQPIQGLYLSGDVGANFAQPLQTSHTNVKITTDPGPVGIAAVGWGFGNGFRAEIEGSVRSNSISGISTLRIDGRMMPVGNTGGDARTYAAMANIAYDIPFHPFGLPLTPYVGAGVGYAWLDLGNATGNEPAIFHLPNHNTFETPATLSYGSAGAFAYQAMIGTSIPIRILPGLSATVEYRFFGTTRANVPEYLTGSNGNTVNGATPSGHSSAGFETLDHAVLIGLRYSFGAPPAPVPAIGAAVPAPAVAQARSFLVFFDWDKATLTDRARQIVAEAASTSTKVQHTRIEVNGYTDTSGTRQYNQGLSLRRGQAVAAELVKDGVPRAAISIQGFGETHPLVPTGAGVREPQNRRVEIIIR
ncbi:OmpA family protein [Acidisphaera sp. S103]|uniref:OmpA family protein n=1 Tax=Acidisphaera sp. S103 TaxID=1747223 RepID=UPI0020B15C85|nr:OmpA family protein [Acidisphaera sp. S103]